MRGEEVGSNVEGALALGERWSILAGTIHCQTRSKVRSRRKRVEFDCTLSLAFGPIELTKDGKDFGINLARSRIVRVQFNRALQIRLCLLPSPVETHVHAT